MKILDISIDRFGAWNDLHLEDLSTKVTVFYGRNEAGKTTLMQFVRTMLFGASETGRRYLSREGREAGGTLQIESETGRYDVARTLRTRRLGQTVADTLTVTGDKGSRHDTHALEIVLSGVDESVYRNVYAIGLREIQELGALSDTEAARHLYDLSAGLDRVSLAEVLRELKTSREELLAGDEQPAVITDLHRRRSELQHKLDQRRDAMLRYRDLLGERNRLAQQIVKIEQQQKELEQKARITELSFSLKDKWTERQQVLEERRPLGTVPPVSQEDVESIGRIGKQLRELQRQQSGIQEQRQRLRDQAEAIPVRRALAGQGPRIEALVEQRSWIRSLDDQAQELGEQVAQLESQQTALRRRLGLKSSADGISSEQVQRAITELRGPARDVKLAKKRREDQRQHEASRQGANQVADEELSTALASRGEQDLTSALVAANERTVTLQERIALDGQLEQIDEHEQDLLQRQDDLLDRQILPPRVLLVTGIVFALGVMLLLAGIFMPTSVVGSLGWFLAILGVMGSGASVAFKFLQERSAQRELTQCERQLKTLVKEKEQASQDRDDLDAILPSGGGPLAVQLRRAETELAGLEQLEESNAQRTASAGSETGRILAGDVDHAYEKAKRAWREALQCVDLPEDLSPRQVRDLASGSGELTRCEQELAKARETFEQRCDELSKCTTRIDDILEQAELESPKRSDLDTRLDMLDHAWTQQKERIDQRDALQVEIREVRSRHVRVTRDIARLQAKRRTRLEELEADSAGDLREMADRYALAQQLDQRHQQLDAEITTARGDVCSEEDLESQLSGTTTEQIERRWDNQTAKLKKITEQLQSHFEKRGQIIQQVRTLSEDRRAARTQLELNCVEQKLSDAIRRWRELAVTALLLDSLRDRYEKERQPATLREASLYLEQLTEGRYRRVWTPLDEDALRVDMADGTSRTLEMLSRGTREQLFLSLRLALVALYAQRGVRLPLVLDDVLVNFDLDRARAAARVLGDFAQRGHQLLIFTCHEHLLDVFEANHAEIRRLPSREQVVSAEPLRVRSAMPETSPADVPLVVASPVSAPAVEPAPVPNPIEEVAQEPAAIPTIDEMPFFDDEIISYEYPIVHVSEETEVVTIDEDQDIAFYEETWETDEEEQQQPESAVANEPFCTTTHNYHDGLVYKYDESEYCTAEDEDRYRAYDGDPANRDPRSDSFEDAA